MLFLVGKLVMCMKCWLVVDSDCYVYGFDRFIYIIFVGICDVGYGDCGGGFGFG